MASEQISTDIRYLAENHPGYLEQVQRNYWRNFALFILEGCFFSFGFAIFASDTILPYLVSELTGNPFLVGQREMTEITVLDVQGKPWVKPFFILGHASSPLLIST